MTKEEFETMLESKNVECCDIDELMSGEEKEVEEEEDKKTLPNYPVIIMERLNKIYSKIDVELSRIKKSMKTEDFATKEEMRELENRLKELERRVSTLDTIDNTKEEESVADNGMSGISTTLAAFSDIERICDVYAYRSAEDKAHAFDDIRKIVKDAQSSAYSNDITNSAPKENRIHLSDIEKKEPEVAINGPDIGAAYSALQDIRDIYRYSHNQENKTSVAEQMFYRAERGIAEVVAAWRGW